MSREFAGSFYQSAAWVKCRASYIAWRRSVDGGMCERCHEVPGKILHHKVELSPENINNPDITLGFDNLMYVCHNCHDQIHGNVSQMPQRMTRYVFDCSGNPIPLSDNKVLPP